MNSLALLAFLFVLGPLVFFHELGHFIMAKLAGVRVEEFGFGFPPRLFKFWSSPSWLVVNGVKVWTRPNVELQPRLVVGGFVEALVDQKRDGTYRLRRVRVLSPEVDDVTPVKEVRGDDLLLRGELTELERGTEYTFNLLLMGAFVRMTGEEDPSDPLSLAAQPKRWRTAVLLGGPVMNLLVAVLLFAITFMVGGYSEYSDPYAAIAHVAAGSPAAQAGLATGDLVLQADTKSITTADELTRYLRLASGQTVLLTVERDGQLLQRPLSVPSATTDLRGDLGITLGQTVIVYIVPDSPAEEAGVAVNDIVLLADGIAVASYEDLKEHTDEHLKEHTDEHLKEHTDEHLGQTILLTLSRDGQTVTLPVQARENPPRGEGAMGIALKEQWVFTYRAGLPKALGMGFVHLWEGIEQLLTLPAMLIRQEVSAKEVRPVGPVGISQLAGDAIEASQQENDPSIILSLAGVISLALGTTNLLPLPALDGGRLLFVVVEAVRGRRVSPDKEGLIHFVGLAVMLALLLLMTISELRHPIELP